MIESLSPSPNTLYSGSVYLGELGSELEGFAGTPPSKSSRLFHGERMIILLRELTSEDLETMESDAAVYPP